MTAPAEVPTVADVKADPAFWIAGPGRAVAERTDCPHGYRLTDTCPGCDADAERAAVQAPAAGRPLPPPLCTTLPPCSICAEEVGTDGDLFVCEHCDCTWPIRGIDDDPGEWNDVTAEQCPSAIRPFEDLTSANYVDIRGNTYRCYLDAEHNGRHINPDYAGTWRDGAPHVIQPAEVTS